MDIPLLEFPSIVQGKPLVVYISGDGGWNSFSQNVVRELNEKMFPVVALDSRKYFWEAKSPGQFAMAIQSVIEKYLQIWKVNSFIVLGYSFGADVAAFLPERLPKNLTEKQKGLFLLSPSLGTDFMIRIGDLLGTGNADNGKYRVLAEIQKSPVPVICIFGRDEEENFSRQIIESENLKKIILPGSHRFSGNTGLLVDLITQNIDQ